MIRSKRNRYIHNNVWKFYTKLIEQVDKYISENKEDSHNMINKLIGCNNSINNTQFSQVHIECLSTLSLDWVINQITTDLRGKRIKIIRSMIFLITVELSQKSI